MNLLDKLYISGDISLEDYIKILYSNNKIKIFIISIRKYYSKKINYL